jgi:hypothetical protein
MGLLSGGNSKNTTVNEDNRTIEDYTGSSFDNSIDNAINGNLNNNTGTINMLDGGAFDLVTSANNNNALLADSVIQKSGAMLDSALSYGQSIFSDGASVIDNANSRTLDAALSVHDSAINQVALGNDLALSLAEINQQASLEGQNNNNSALTNGFKSMMQFAENFSRSDGTAVAKVNMQTIAVIALSGVAIAFFFKGKK